MEKRKDLPIACRRGLLESLLRRRDPGGELPFDEDEEENSAADHFEGI